MSYDADKDNIYAFVILLLICWIFLGIIYSIFLFSYGWKIVKSIDFTLICLMIILETVELIFRLSSNFDNDKDTILISTFLNINRVLRVLMVHRRLVVFTTIITTYFSKFIVKVKSFENKQGIFELMKELLIFIFKLYRFSTKN